MNNKKFINTARDVINIEIKALQSLKKILIAHLVELSYILQSVNQK